MISILVLFLLGVASSKQVSIYRNGSFHPPIISKSQERRICAELCLSGLGGEPCGDDCLDVMPQGLPTVPSSSQSVDKKYTIERARKTACPMLCTNRLGYPLCDCNYTEVTTPFFRVNYLQICSYFCKEFNYQIYGCDVCGVYKNMTDSAGSDYYTAANGGVSRKTYDWNEWCVSMCQEGDGGAACYCDLLPFTMKI